MAKSIVYVWLRSFLAVIAVIMAIFLAFSIWASYKINEEIKSLNYNTSIFIRNGIDVQLEKLQALSYEIMYNSMNVSLSKSSNPSDFTSLQTYTFINYIKNSLLANSFLEDIYIYYPQYDYVVGNLGSYRSRAYYLLLNKLESSGYERWLADLRNPKQLNYYTANSSKGSSLYFSRYMPINNDSRVQSVLIAKVRSTAVKEVLQWANAQNPNRLLAMLDADNNVYAFEGDSSLADLVKGRVDAVTGKTIDIDDKFIIVQPSRIAGFKYLLVKEKGDVHKVEYALEKLAMVCGILSLIGGLLLAFHMAKKNIRPLTYLVERLWPDTEKESLNEYDLIERRINLMLKENDSAIQQMERQQNLLNRAFVSTLFRGSYRNEHTIYAMMGMYNISFEHPCFCIASVRLNKPSDDTPMPDWDSFVKKMDNSKLFALFSEIDGIYAFILNFENYESQVLTEDFANRAIEFAALSGCKGCAGVGSTYDSMSDIVTSYEESLKALDSCKEAVIACYTKTRFNLSSAGPDKDVNDESIACKAKCIIDSSYNDPMLGLYSISAAIGLSNSYISRVFKQKYGIGITKYINRVRVEKAKELIAMGNMNIKSIAISVGFSSDISFIRVFKKHEQTTPGRYKNG